jgi:hypothetical protein
LTFYKATPATSIGTQLNGEIKKGKRLAMAVIPVGLVMSLYL